MALNFNSFVVGLTGGIASGKTAVSDTFKSLGVDIIDADLIARDVVKTNSKGLNQLVETFGESILDKGKLNRAALRKIVFNDENKLNLINSILHPLIRKKIINQVLEVKNKYCIVVIPLLCESDDYGWLDRVLVVDVQPETQLTRLLKRDGITVELAKKMMSKQCSKEQRLSIADDVINNEQTLIQLKQKVLVLDKLYKNWKH
jgi:dephospho-CoA kinase